MSRHFVRGDFLVEPEEFSECVKCWFYIPGRQIWQSLKQPFESLETLNRPLGSQLRKVTIFVIVSHTPAYTLTTNFAPAVDPASSLTPWLYFTPGKYVWLRYKLSLEDSGQAQVKKVSLDWSEIFRYCLRGDLLEHNFFKITRR